MKFYKRAHDGVEWHVIELDEEEISAIRQEHNNLSLSLLQECLNLIEDKNPFLAAALFNKKCISFMEMIDQRLELKIAHSLKKMVKLSKKGEGWMLCPACGAKIKKYYRPGYRWFCGSCKNYKIAMDEEEIKKFAVIGRQDSLK